MTTTGPSPEIAPSYGALDTESIIDGDAGHAHVLRELARNPNRLLQQGGPPLNLAWASSHDGTESTNARPPPG